MKKKLCTVLSVCCLLAINSSGFVAAYGQPGIQVECGSIVENEFTANKEHHIYLIDMKARESFTASVEPFSSHLKNVIEILGPTDLRIDKSSINPTDAPSLSSGTLAATGVYKIDVFNWNGATYGGVGGYTLHIGCETESGVINPGDASLPAPTSPAAPAPLTQSKPIPDFSSMLEVNRPYHMFFAGGVHAVSVLEINNLGWVKIQFQSTANIAWLNLNQVTYFMPVE